MSAESVAIAAIFAALRSTDKLRKTQGAQELRDTVIAFSRESPKNALRLSQEVNKLIFEMIRAPDANQRLGGVLAIDQLITCNTAGEDSSVKATRFTNYLRQVILTPDIEVIQAAASAIGKLSTSGSLAGTLVEFEVNRCIEWLTTDRQEIRRQAAALELKALATSSPTLMFAYVQKIVDALWYGIRDTKISIRQDSASALGSCLEIVRHRDMTIQESLYTSVYTEAVSGIKSSLSEVIHGSLLVYRELLSNAGSFMIARYKRTIASVMDLQDHKDIAVRRLVIEILPTCASYNAPEFIEHYLSNSMSLMLQQLNGKSSEKALVFTSIGMISLSVGRHMTPYLDTVLNHMREALGAKLRVRWEQENAIYKCLRMFGVAFGQALTKYMDRGTLDLLFAGGFTRAFYECMKSLCASVPPLGLEVGDMLLNTVSHGLCGYGYKQPGSPSYTFRVSDAISHDFREALLTKVSGDMSETDLLTLFLITLADFDFKDRILAPFCRDCVIRYAEHENTRVRKAAALTCCKVFIKEPISSQLSSDSLNTVQYVLEKLLIIGVTDSSPDVRREVLMAMDPKLDPHLAQPDNIKRLFMALNDELFGIRQVVIQILGRLSKVNPAYVIPTLRKTMIELLTDIEFSSNTRSKEENAKLLASLMKHSTGLVHPYVDPILRVLIPAAQNTTVSTVSSNVVDAIGELSPIGGRKMLAHVDKIMPILLDMLQDQSSLIKRDTALQTLGKLASSSEYVIEPYYQYPILLSVLVKILVSDSNHEIQREVIRLIGILGALDPYKAREIEHNADDGLEADEQSSIPIDMKLVLKGTAPSNEDYNPTVVIHSLMILLKDPAMAPHHTIIVQAVLFIFKSLGLKCVLFLDQVIPGLLNSMKNNTLAMIEFLFRQISTLTTVVKQHIRPFLGDIFAVMKEHFRYPSLHPAILTLVESLALALDGEFKVYMPELLPSLLQVLQADDTESIPSKIRVLDSLYTFGLNLEDYTHLIVPNVVNLLYFSPQNVRIAALQCLSDLAQTLKLEDMASRVVLPLLRILDSATDDNLRKALLETLCNVCYQLGPTYAIFVESANSTIQRVRTHISVAEYEKLTNRILRNGPLPQNMNPYRKRERTSLDATPADNNTRLPLNQNGIKQAWDTTGRSTKDDWTEWFRRLSVEFLKQSPSPAMRACAGIAVVCPSLARDLFNPSFYSVWVHLYDQYKDDLIGNMQNAMSSQNIPPEVLQTLLTLAEFMERDDKPLPLTPRVLASYAQKCHAYAKALHYKELDFIADPSASTIESLISINNQLQQSDAAIGILKHAQHHHSLQLKETWYEKLQRWEEALAAYKEREKVEPDSMEVTLGKMRCLHALGEWEQLSQITQERWSSSGNDVKRAIAPLAAAAAWGLGNWEQMNTYINVMKPQSPDKSFFKSILCLHRNNFEEATNQIQTARDQLITELTALVSESYNRAYGVVVRVQMLAELEEIMRFKMLPENADEERTIIKNTWDKRLMGVQRNVDIWQRVLNVKTLVMSPKENMTMWIKFANLCRKSNRIGLAEKSLNHLLDVDHDTSRAPPHVVYAQLKFMWATENQQNALRYLIDFTTRMSHDLNLDQKNLMQPPAPLPGATNTSPEIENYTKLLARCFLKQGEWHVALNPGWKCDQDLKASILGSYLLATHFDPTWYKAWHSWALANFEVVSLFEHSRQRVDKQAEAQDGLPSTLATSASNNPSTVTPTISEQLSDYGSDELGATPVENTRVSINQGAGVAGEKLSGLPALVPGEIIEDAEALKSLQAYVIPAIQGFFHSITLAPKSALQDTLRLLTLWFKYGGLSAPSKAMNEGFGTVNIEIWLEVVPQLISRIHQPNEIVRNTLHALLAQLGKKHPQALVYPLQVSIKSDDIDRKTAAQSILNQMRSHNERSATLVMQADMVSHELIRVAVLWHELWHEGLEDASRHFFVEHDIPKMFRVLEPLHETLNRGPSTLREISFETAFGRDLADAYEWTQKYKRTSEISHLNQAWDVYYSVFRRISRQLPQLFSLDLHYVSPVLLAAKDLQLAVPGTYEPGRPEVTIQMFDPTFSVISSKQRPRRFTIKGSDGKEYQYVLKGHEDIRQDSLVMQLFGLVNTLLADQPECFKRHLSIQQYPAIPLSPKAGLLGWVPHSDTLHYLIREYREGKSLLNIEHRIMIQMAPDYENLTHLQKIEVFTYALDNTKGQDLYRILWLKSKSSEAWLDRRTQYTRSLAVMSMVGYILGLGDRHPLNLMLDRVTGRIIHIDFGDCFEAAILRDKFPEKVPFRLTRMLTYAMEVSGVEGSYRITCEHVMALLRDNSESLMAILEAFANDPLINWGFEFPKKNIDDADEAATTPITPEPRLSEDIAEEVSASAGKGASDAKASTNASLATADDASRTTRAQLVLRRIREKLTGNDFRNHSNLTVPNQVDLLIQEATNIENLCQHFIGWCSFW